MSGVMPFLTVVCLLGPFLGVGSSPGVRGRIEIRTGSYPCQGSVPRHRIAFYFPVWLVFSLGLSGFCDGDDVGVVVGGFDCDCVVADGDALALGEDGTVVEVPVAGIARYFEREFP